MAVDAWSAELPGGWTAVLAGTTGPGCSRYKDGVPSFTLIRPWAPLLPAASSQLCDPRLLLAGRDDVKPVLGKRPIREWMWDGASFDEAVGGMLKPGEGAGKGAGGRGELGSGGERSTAQEERCTGVGTRQSACRKGGRVGWGGGGLATRNNLLWAGHRARGPSSAQG